MTPDAPPGQPPDDVPPPGDDTAAFQRFYAKDDVPAQHGPLYRLLVGWWRRD